MAPDMHPLTKHELEILVNRFVLYEVPRLEGQQHLPTHFIRVLFLVSSTDVIPLGGHVS
jgi:hypothetical protein